MCKFYKPCPKDAVCQISEYLDSQFIRRRFFKIHQILHLVVPYGAPKRASPLIFANLNPHSQRCFLSNLVEIGLVVLESEHLNVFPYISLCKMKRPLVGPFLGGFYFYVQILQTMSQGCCMSNIRLFGQPVREKKIHFFGPFLPLMGPQKVPAP